MDAGRRMWTIVLVFLMFCCPMVSRLSPSVHPVGGQLGGQLRRRSLGRKAKVFGGLASGLSWSWERKSRFPSGTGSSSCRMTSSGGGADQDQLLRRRLTNSVIRQQLGQPPPPDPPPSRRPPSTETPGASAKEIRREQLVEVEHQAGCVELLREFSGDDGRHRLHGEMQGRFRSVRPL